MNGKNMPSNYKEEFDEELDKLYPNEKKDIELVKKCKTEESDEDEVDL